MISISHRQPYCAIDRCLCGSFPICSKAGDQKVGILWAHMSTRGEMITGRRGTSTSEAGMSTGEREYLIVVKT